MEFLDIQVGDEVRILSATWNGSEYGYPSLGNPSKYNNKIVTITRLQQNYCKYGSYKLVGFEDGRHTYYLIPVANLIEPMCESLAYMSKSKFLEFDAKVLALRSV